MSVASPPRTVGDLLRQWRHQRRMSQLDLAVDADVSARHLSFVETGRSRPSRELVLHLAEHLDVPLRDRNTLLMAAGFAPTYPETPLDADEMAPVRDALDRILTSHQPFPAVVVDRHWNLVTANQTALTILSDGVDPELLGPRANALRVCLHPDGLAPRIVNLAQYSAHLIERLDRLAAASADPELLSLRDELRRYPGVAEGHPGGSDTASRLFVPLVLRDRDGSGDGDLTFFSTIATFGTAHDITVAELAIESFFPADGHTSAVLNGL
ncbi:MAG TPA: helix-turn-helix transcriptional regulator [Acidimicrobiales bacterium]|jgi:transcriptional regulator with XRE-family HTH domain|nr:helix-turn-helix transcriptional regulator [Acidimicrobiales bacterium]